MQVQGADVRCASSAVLSASKRDFCFAPITGHQPNGTGGPFRAIKRHPFDLGQGAARPSYRRWRSLGTGATWDVPRPGFRLGRGRFITCKRYDLRSGRSRRCRTASGPWGAWRKRWKSPRTRRRLPTGQSAFSFSISNARLRGQVRAAMAAIGFRHMYRAACPAGFSKHTRLGASDRGRGCKGGGSKQGNGEDHFA